MLDTPISFIYVVEWPVPLSGPLMSLRPARVCQSPRTSLGEWILVACFSSVKNHNVSRPHLFPSFTTRAKKIPLPPLGRSYNEQKKSLCNGLQFRTLFLPHRFIKIRPSHQRPVSIEFLTIVGFQNSPNLSKIEKVAETCEFDGKEPLFVERTIAISLRVLG